MEMKIFNNLLDLVAQRGVLVLSQVFGFGYLVLALRSSSFNRDEATVGLVLVLTGALFEYLITMAKVRYLSRNIDDRQKENDQLRAEIHRGVKYIEQTQDEIKVALETVGRGKTPVPLATFKDSDSE